MTSQGFFIVSSAAIFQVEGRDATRYLQARLTNDIRLLAPGTSCLAAMLTAQGCTQGLFRVFALSSEKYLLCGDGGNHQEILKALKKFIVADRVNVTDLSETFSLLHLLLAPPQVPHQLGLSVALQTLTSPNFIVLSNELLVSLVPRSAQCGIDVLGPILPMSSLTSTCQEVFGAPLGVEVQEVLRIKSGIASFPQELNEDTLFSESGRVDAVSFKKGCYVGQEVVEKIDARGKLARTLRQIRLKGSAPTSREEQVLSTQGAVIGEIVSSAVDHHERCTYAFARLKNLPELHAGSAIMVRDIPGEILV